MLLLPLIRHAGDFIQCKVAALRQTTNDMARPTDACLAPTAVQPAQELYRICEKQGRCTRTGSQNAAPAPTVAHYGLLLLLFACPATRTQPHLLQQQEQLLLGLVFQLQHPGDPAVRFSRTLTLMINCCALHIFWLASAHAALPELEGSRWSQTRVKNVTGRQHATPRHTVNRVDRSGHNKGLTTGPVLD
jgi:hypothetical protein